MALTLAVLGSLQVSIDSVSVGVTAAQERSLIAVLVSQGGRHVVLDRLVDELWPDRPSADPAASVHVLMSRLRRRFGPVESQRLVTHERGYALDLEGVELDAATFTCNLRDARAFMNEGDLRSAVDRLRSALALWRGDPFQDLRTSIAEIETYRLTEARTSAFEALFEAELARGRHGEILGELDQAVAEQPFHERFWGMRMLALYRGGRQSEALQAYRSLRNLTRNEFGFEPTPELQRLERAMLHHDPDLDWTGAPVGKDPAIAAFESGAFDGGILMKQLPLQPLLRAFALGTMVGREPERAALKDTRKIHRSAKLRAAVVVGEPGVGKTCLVVNDAFEAFASGTTVLAGRCDEDPIGPFQPVAEIVRWILENTAQDQIEASLSDASLRQLQRIAPPSETDPLPLQDADSNPIELFEAVAALFCVVASTRQLLLLIEDLHWVDPPTAAMLRYLLRRLEGESIVIVCTLRSSETEDSDSAQAVVDTLRRTATIRDVVVPTLEPEAVSALARSVLGRPVDRDTAGALHEESGGNPLFVVELLRHLVDTEALGEIAGENDAVVVRNAEPPQSIREIVERRIARLDPRFAQVLSVGAVLGPAFDSGVVAIAAAMDPNAVSESLDSAQAAGLLTTFANVPGRFAFSHAIIHRTIYELIPPGVRTSLHRSIAGALEHESMGTPAQLALHHHEAADGRDISKAVEVAVWAARESRVALAFDDSVEILQRTRSLTEARGTTRQKVEVLLTLGEAHWWAGDVDRSQGVCAEALELLQRDGSASGELLARAVLGRWRNNGAATQGFSAAEPDLELIDMIEEALNGLDEHPALRAALLGRLGIASYWTAPIERRQEIADSAVALARASGNESVLLDVLVDRQLTLWTAGAEPQRLVHSKEVLTLARRLRQSEREADAWTFQAVDHLALGDVRSADAAIRHYLRASTHLRQPFYRWHAHYLPALRALMDGRFEEAETLTAAATDDGEIETPGAEGAAALNGLQTLWLCYERGLLPAIAPLLESVAGSFGEIPALSAARVWVSAEAGNIERATEELDRLVRDDFDIPQTDIAWLAAMCLLASAAATVEHEVAARKLREVIAPYSGRNVLVWVGMCCGPVDHYLGRLNVCLGDLAAAAEAFDAAVEMTTAMNATPLNLRVRLDRCQVAIRSGAAQVDVLVELDEIGRRASELGMAGVAAAASSLGEATKGEATRG